MLDADADKPDARMVNELIARYRDAARRLRETVFNPPGKTPRSQKFNQARAATLLSQVEKLVSDLKTDAANWSGTALDSAMHKGIRLADQQAESAGIRRPDDAQAGSFALVDRRSVEKLAEDTVGDLIKAADSMGRNTMTALRRMAATGVTNAEVNQILTTGIITGRPVQAIRGLRDSLKKVHGEVVTVIDKNGNPRDIPVGAYAKMVAVTKTREATREARHARLKDRGLDLVVITGSRSDNFCTAYVGKVFSISGDHPDFPALSSLPGDGPPFHPNCSKGTAPFVEELADPIEIEEGKPDKDTELMLNRQDRNELQKIFKAKKMRQAVKERVARIQAAPPALAHAKFVPTSVFSRQSFVSGNQTADDFMRGLIRDHQDVLPNRLPEAAIATKDQARIQSRAGAAVSYDPTSGKLIINPGFKQWEQVPAMVRESAARGLISTDHAAYPLLQETAHAEHHEKVGDAKFLAAMNSGFGNRRTYELISREVSVRAVESQTEFVAEVYAGLRTGRTYPRSIMNWYQKLEGP